MDMIELVIDCDHLFTTIDTNKLIQLEPMRRSIYGNRNILNAEQFTAFVVVSVIDECDADRQLIEAV